MKYFILLFFCLSGLVFFFFFENDSDSFPAERSSLPNKDVASTAVRQKHSVSSLKPFSSDLSGQLSSQNQKRIEDEDAFEDHVARQGVGKTPALSDKQAEELYPHLQGSSSEKYLSVMAQLDDYDEGSFRLSPEDYLSKAFPARAFQSAQPGEGKGRLKVLGDYYREVSQGETTQLRVRAAPGSPVSFFSPDLGCFDNNLTAISVQADGSGIATVRFHMKKGTYGRCNIVCASPEMYGQGKFVIYGRFKKLK